MHVVVEGLERMVFLVRPRVLLEDIKAVPDGEEDRRILGRVRRGHHAEAAGGAVVEESVPVGVHGDDAVAATAAAEGGEVPVADGFLLDGIVEGYGGTR